MAIIYLEKNKLIIRGEINACESLYNENKSSIQANFGINTPLEKWDTSSTNGIFTAVCQIA